MSIRDIRWKLVLTGTLFFLCAQVATIQAESWNIKLLNDVKSGKLNRVEEDVRRATDLDSRDRFDNTSLIWAARRGRFRIVRILVDRGVDVNAANRFGVTALMWAVMRDHKDIVRLLLQKNADPNIKNEDGETALMWAAKKDYRDTADLLLSNGAHLESTNSARQTAQMIAQNAGHQDMVQFFQQWISMQRGASQPSGAAIPFIARFGVDKPSYHLPDSSDKWALVVGIETYQASAVAPAEYAVRDAQAVEKHLLALGFEPDHIIELLGNNATGASIRSSLHRLAKWSSADSHPGTTIFVYFSGHGAPDIKNSTSYIVPWDGDPSDLADTGINLSEFYRTLDKIPANHVIVALDACFSGSGKGAGSVFGQGTRPLIVKVHDESIPHPGKMIVMSAAQGDEMAGPKPDREHGLFTYYLLKGLNGAAATDDHVSIGELFHYVFAKVRNQSEKKNFNQLPALQPENSSTVNQVLLR